MEPTASSPNSSDASASAADQALAPSPAAFVEADAGMQFPTRVEDLSLDQMMVIFDQQERAAAAAAELAASVPASDIPTQETPEAAPVPEALAAPEDMDGPARYRLKVADDRDEMIFALKKRNPDVPIEVLIARMNGVTTPVPVAGEKTPPAAPAVSTLDTIAERQTALAEELQAAHESMDFELVGKLSNEQFRLIEQKMVATSQQAQAAAQQEQAVNTQWEDYDNQTAALYPAAANRNSTFYQEMLSIHAALGQAGDPLLEKPESTLRIAQMAAARLAVAPATLAPASAAPVALIPSAPVRVRPVSGGTSPAGNPQSAATAVAALQRMTPDELASWTLLNFG